MDGIEGLLRLPKHSVDMLLTDPPYGITQNAWDVPLPLEEFWQAVQWAVKPNGAILIFSQCPYDKVLGMSNLKQLRYEWIWCKSQGKGFLNARRAPLKQTETILVFYQKAPKYHPQYTKGKPYESRRHQNCVFVGKDPSGRPRSAALRGTRDSFKLDAEGSDKRYTFCLPASEPACPRLAVAESPIDALSLATLEKRTGRLWQDCHYLSLGGTAPRALLQFLRDHPAVNQISLCLDNDKAGLDGMERLEQAVRADPALAARVTLLCRNPPPAEYGKDYNDLLAAVVRMERGQRGGREAR